MVSGNVASWTATSFTSSNPVYGFFRFKLVNAPDANGADICTILDYDGVNMPLSVYVVLVNTNRTLKLAHSDGDTDHSVSGSTVLSLDTIYYVWFYFAKGTGSNGVAWLKLGTTPTIPGTNEISITGGVGTANVYIAEFSMLHDAAYEYIVDQFLLKTSAIGDVCN
jgi:hypothetical protein